MDKWVCELCGYVYDPEKGAEGAAPGTPFDDLPDDWECPECFAEKERFVNINQRRKEFPRS
ncbi:MAG: rubredoxin [Firmicutes bacterium]|nr:rubredoxin [Bacillota bacterium]